MAWLEIRRASSITISDVTKDERIFSIDWLPSDRPDIGTPYVTFVFNFELCLPEDESASPAPMPSPSRTLRNSSIIQADEDGDSKHSLSSMVQQTASSTAAAAASPGSEDATPSHAKSCPTKVDLTTSDPSDDEQTLSRSIATTRKRTSDSTANSKSPQRRPKRPRITASRPSASAVSPVLPPPGERLSQIPTPASASAPTPFQVPSEDLPAVDQPLPQPQQQQPTPPPPPPPPPPPATPPMTAATPAPPVPTDTSDKDGEGEWEADYYLAEIALIDVSRKGAMCH